MTKKQVYIIKTPDIRERAAKAVMAIRGDDNAEVIIQPHIENQTHEQRKFFHAMCKLFADEIGESPEAVKQAAKKEAFGSDVVTVGELTVEVIKPSSVAKKDEYSFLIETLYRQAAFCGVILPSPLYKE